MLSSGKNIDPEAIEATYGRSVFIKEICVVALADPSEPATERLFAAVVPDLELVRKRRIVNIGDLLRFEMEGQSIHLPPHKRILGYEVSFEQLPRTTTGQVKRHEVEQWLRAKRERRSEPEAEGDADAVWTDDAYAAQAAAIIRPRAHGRMVRPGSNLELDLGIDSMERVALMTELEQRFGVRIPAESAHELLTVSQLIEACRPAFARAAYSRELRPGKPRAGDGTDGMVEESWALLLRDLPAESDPLLDGLFARRRVALPFFFVVSRLARLVLGPAAVVGLEHLPREGPYIISPNHQSYLDPVIVCSVLPYRLFPEILVVGATEYFETPFMRWLAQKLNLLPVDPDANLVTAMKVSAFGLTHGKILIVFPEGERSIDGTVKRFKKGAPILAQHLNVPIVPVAIRGAFELWPRNRPLNWRVLRPWSRHVVRVAFGPPMRFDRVSEYAASASRLRDAVENMWNRAE